ncbi:hypothetical protein A3E06_00510 [Candidatus Giovannonibacteria bacterium RIFCSPHIGHO2_12_FULL_44_42]|nr:MAG: Peptidase M23 family protein [Parcubacteria group bacterium GW2011_GWA2_44_13]OGF73914.1 MAG: hypothetical protein A3E06_00510 [Candidatus Giovannonibacteria bacterium RIFCSPHIGHO2_12_FULL_44_42]
MFWPVLVGVFVAIIFNTFAPAAKAGFLSFLENIFSAGASNEANYNSQNIPLLQAPQTSDPGAVGGVSMDFVEDSAILPVVGPLGSIADVDTYKLDQITTYTVRAGDSVSEIAKMFGVSTNTIYWANDLKKGQVIKTGQVLVILPISGIQYEVKKGDTIKSLAKKFKSDEEEILAFNGLAPGGSLAVGETIIIPDAEVTILSVSGSFGSTARLRGAGGPAIDGYYIRPILGGRKSQGLHGFNGVDLANSCGTSVYASAGGTVLVARSQGWNGGYGEYVVIAHPNGTQTVYSHLSSVFVSVGQYTVQGTTIGTVGSTGNSTGCHLHFEVRGARNPF